MRLNIEYKQMYEQMKGQLTLKDLRDPKTAPRVIYKRFRSMREFQDLPDTIVVCEHTYIKKQDEFLYHSGKCPCCGHRTESDYAEAIYVRKDLLMP